MAGGAASAKKVLTAERQQQAVELRKGGMSFRDIANYIKAEYKLKSYSPKTAERDVKSVMRAYIDTAFGDVEELFALEMMRLDDMQAAIWNDVIGGKLDAFDRALRLVALRAELAGTAHIGSSLLQKLLSDKENRGATLVDASYRIVEVVKDYGKEKEADNVP